MLVLVASLHELIANIKRYQNAVAVIISTKGRWRITPSQVQDWYYVPDLQMVGPSRFIGYKGMTLSRYQNCRKVDGGQTERHLRAKGWFTELSEKDAEYAKARRLAANLCHMVRQGSTIYPSARFYILK